MKDCSLLGSTITMHLLTIKRYLSDEYKRLRRKENQAICDSDLLLSDVSLNVCLLNIKSLRIHAGDVQCDDFLLNNDFLFDKNSNWIYPY